jgi:prolyl oligopeptidase
VPGNRWLERRRRVNPNLLSATRNPDNAAWEARENSRSREYLHALPGYQQVRDRLRELATRSKSGPLTRAGDRWFQQEDHDFARVTVRETPDGPPRTILDVAEIAVRHGAPTRLVWFVPSPDAKLVAASVEVAGREDAQVLLIDVPTGRQLDLDLPYHPAWPVAWLPDSSGFFVDDRNFAGGEFTGNDDRIYLYRFGRPLPAAESLPVPRLRFPQVFMSAEGRYALLVVDNRTDYVYSLGTGEWLPFLAGAPGAHRGDFSGDDFIAIVADKQHPRGRIVRIPLATRTDTTTWAELVPETDDVLLHLDVFGDRFVVGMLRELQTRLAVHDLHGTPRDVVELPGAGTAGGRIATAAVLGEAPFVRGGGEISFTFSTPTTSPVTYRYEVDSERLTALTEPAFTMEGCTTEQIVVTSHDGCAVPATLLYRSNLADRPLPTVIEAYGNFGLAMLPSFRETAVPVVEAGGCYVLAHLRGGGEYGRHWWDDGRLANKQHTFDDLYAVAEQLISAGRTTRGQLAFHGASGGGLTAGVAIVQRPDLFTAVVPRSPVLDLLNRDSDPLQDSIASREYGDITDPAQYAWMQAYSPVEHVIAGTDYPACLFVTGENDPRCKVWQSRKMAVLLGSATTSSAPVLLRIHSGRGHAAVGAEAYAAETAEWLTFIGSRIGLDLASNAGCDRSAMVTT